MVRVFLYRSRFGADYRQLESLPLFVSVLDDLQKIIVLNVTPMNLPTALLTFQTTAAIALRVVLDSALTQLAGGRHVEKQRGADVQPDFERAVALRAFNFLFHGGRFPRSFLVEANPLDNLIQLAIIQQGAVRVDHGGDVALVLFGR
ncbi:hypothetical protein ALO37_200174 [Pseudomonas savastanoi pv. glycinea]|nr:hypothetical protein ALO37_200174 [Pseudomonas savastanoi pv. glycinea]